MLSSEILLLSLHEFDVSSINIETFESRLDKGWSKQTVCFCYKKELQLWSLKSVDKNLGILRLDFTDNGDDAEIFTRTGAAPGCQSWESKSSGCRFTAATPSPHHPFTHPKSSNLHESYGLSS